MGKWTLHPLVAGSHPVISGGGIPVSWRSFKPPSTPSPGCTSLRLPTGMERRASPPPMVLPLGLSVPSIEWVLRTKGTTQPHCVCIKTAGCKDFCCEGREQATAE